MCFIAFYQLSLTNIPFYKIINLHIVNSWNNTRVWWLFCDTQVYGVLRTFARGKLRQRIIAAPSRNCWHSGKPCSDFVRRQEIAWRNNDDGPLLGDTQKPLYDFFCVRTMSNSTTKSYSQHTYSIYIFMLCILFGSLALYTMLHNTKWTLSQRNCRNAWCVCVCVIVLYFFTLSFALWRCSNSVSRSNTLSLTASNYDA